MAVPSTVESRNLRAACQVVGLAIMLASLPGGASAGDLTVSEAEIRLQLTQTGNGRQSPQRSANPPADTATKCYQPVSDEACPCMEFEIAVDGGLQLIDNCAPANKCTSGVSPCPE